MCSAFLFATVICLICQKKKECFSKPENLFLLLSLVLCPLYLFCVPVFQVPDEVNHYVRAYGIVHGYLLSPEGGNIPVPENLVPYEWYTYTPFIMLKHFNMQIDPAASIMHNNVNMALYSPVSYVFQVLGIGAADFVSDNTYLLVMAGSIANMAGCTLLLYYAVKYIPYGKEVLAFISLLPMALQERQPFGGCHNLCGRGGYTGFLSAYEVQQRENGQTGNSAYVPADWAGFLL